MHDRSNVHGPSLQDFADEWREIEAINLQRISGEHARRAMEARFRFIDCTVFSLASVKYNADESAYWSKIARRNLFALIGDRTVED